VLSEWQLFVARLASTPWPEADIRGSTSLSRTIFCCFHFHARVAAHLFAAGAHVFVLNFGFE
jgi:hypothetical protein